MCVSTKEETRILRGKTQKRRAGLKWPLQDKADCSVGRICHLFPKIKYLGTWVSFYLRNDHDVAKRLAASNSSMWYLSKKWEDKNVDTYSKYMLFQAVLCNLLLWGCESWALRKYLLSSPEVFLNMGIRRTLKIKMGQVIDQHIKNFNTRDVLQHPDGLEPDQISSTQLTWQAIPTRGAVQKGTNRWGTPEPPPRCKGCRIQVPAGRLNTRHYASENCKHGEERRRWHETLQRCFNVSRVSFHINAETLTPLESFPYLGPKIEYNNSNWVVVYPNMRKAGRWWIMIMRVLVKTGSTVRARGFQFPCSQNCETRNFFAQNIPETIDGLKSQLTRVPDVGPSTDGDTIWLKSYSTRVSGVCPSTNAETIRLES